jgi:hypothetical protein
MIDEVLVERGFPSFLRLIKYEMLAQGNSDLSEEQILELMAHDPRFLEVWHAANIPLETFERRYHINLSCTRQEKTTRLRENIYTLQSYLRDGVQETLIQEGSFATFRPPFFLYKEEWRKIKADESLLPVKPSFPSRNHITEDFLLSRDSKKVGYTLKQGLFSSAEDRQKAFDFIFAGVREEDRPKVLKPIGIQAIPNDKDWDTQVTQVITSQELPKNISSKVLSYFLKLDALLLDGHQSYFLKEYTLAEVAYTRARKTIQDIVRELRVYVGAFSWNNSLNKGVGEFWHWQGSCIALETFCEFLDPAKFYHIKSKCGIERNSGWSPGLMPNNPCPQYVTQYVTGGSKQIGPFSDYKLHASKQLIGLVEDKARYQEIFKPIDVADWDPLLMDYPETKKIPEGLTYNYTGGFFHHLRRRYFGRVQQKVDANHLEPLIERNVVKVSPSNDAQASLVDVNDDLLSLIPHLLFFVLPLCQGDVAAAKGDFATAANYYAQILREPLFRGSQKTFQKFVNPESEADGLLPWGWEKPDWNPLETGDQYPFNGHNYPYLNQDLEVPLLKARLANLYLNWAESLYRTDLEANVYRARELYKAVMRLYGLDPLSKDHLYTSLPIKVALRTFNGKYLAAEGGGGGALNADRDWIREWETFELVDLVQAKTGLVIKDNNSQSITVALQTHNGSYICTEEHEAYKLAATQNGINDLSIFELIWKDKNSSKIALRAYNGKYVAAEGGGGGELYADRDWTREWETFDLVDLSNPQNNPAVTAQQLRARSGLIQIKQDLNFYGYSSDFVPQLRSKVLLEKAKESAAEAEKLGANFLDYKKAADDDRIEILKSWRDKSISAKTIDISRIRRKQAENNLQQAEFQLRLVQNSIIAKESEIADEGSVCGQVRQVASGVASLIGSMVAGGAAAGIMGAMVSYAVGTYNTLSGMADAANQRLSELQLLREQEYLAKGLVNNWEREIIITNWQEQLAAFESGVAETIIKRLINREINPEFLTRIAALAQVLAETYLDNATEYAWLARQALRYRLAYENKDLGTIEFSYLSPGKEIYENALLLKLVVTNLDNQLTDTGQERPQERFIKLSLARYFPFEFHQLKAKGYCQFITSSDLLRQAWPNNYGFHIRSVKVESQGVEAIGEICNSGISRLERETVGDWITLIGPRGQRGFPATAIDNISEEDNQWLVPFEGNGLDTLWEISLPPLRNPNGLESLTDLYISISLWAGKSIQREAILKTEWAQHGLPVRTHTILFSAKQRFPESFTAFLSNIQREPKLEFKLTKDDFPKVEQNRKVSNVAVFFQSQQLNKDVKGKLSSESVPEGAYFHTVDGFAHSNRIPEPAATRLALPASPLDVLTGVSPIQKWWITLSDSLTQLIIDDVILGIEYTTQIGF